MLPPKGHLEATELPFRFDKFEEITRKTIFTVLLEAVSLLETVDGGCIQAILATFINKNVATLIVESNFLK